MVGLVEGLYDLGAPVISPSVLLLLPILHTAAYASWRITGLTGSVALLYLLRHSYLNRSEYISYAHGFSADDISRIVIFAVAVAGLMAIAQYREQQREVQLSLQKAYQGSLEANRAKSDFLAVVSHELRTPLTTIIQYTDLLTAGIGGAVNAEQRQMLERIEDGALHLRAMIQQLLGYAQIERSGPRIHLETVDLAKLVRLAAALLEPSANEKGLRLQVDIPPGECPVETDPDKVRQIVLNLTENAIKFTEVGQVSVLLQCSAASALLSVSDTGIGIPADAMGRIFEPFWQGEDALTRKRGGLGLGLAITRELVAALGGEIGVQSEVGRGSTFTVRLPRPA
jgi:signal transduction histidine kinase